MEGLSAPQGKEDHKIQKLSRRFIQLRRMKRYAPYGKGFGIGEGNAPWQVCRKTVTAACAETASLPMA